MTACERNGCGHPLGRHMACGPCIIDGCNCSGFHMLSGAEKRTAAKAAAITRCSRCARRVRPGGPHGRETNTDEMCPRKGMGPDRAESWKP